MRLIAYIFCVKFYLIAVTIFCILYNRTVQLASYMWLVGQCLLPTV